MQTIEIKILEKNLQEQNEVVHYTEPFEKKTMTKLYCKLLNTGPGPLVKGSARC